MNNEDRNSKINDPTALDQPSLLDASDEELMAAAEAILFAMGDSVEISALARALGVRHTRMMDIIALLQKKYDSPSSGLMIRRLDDAVQMSTRPQQYANLIRIAQVPQKVTLSDSVLETLSIIAYKQPVTRAEIEDIRGVSCDYAVNRLLDYDLIREAGRMDAPGRPILFATTEQFLRSFGMTDLTELPAVGEEQLEEIHQEAQAQIDSRLGI